MNTVFDPEYGPMRASTHRMPTTKIGAPSLVWQRAFWRPTHIADKELIPGVDDDVWHRNIDLLLAHLYVFLSNSTELKCPNYGKDDCLYLFDHVVHLRNIDNGLTGMTETEKSQRHNNFSLSGLYQGQQFTVSARRNLEYFELIIISEFNITTERKFSDTKLGFIESDIKRLHDIAKIRYRPTAVEFIPDPSQDEKEVLDRSHMTVIEAYRTWASCIVDDALSQRLADAKLTLSDCGGVFADFVGLVMSLKTCDRNDAAPQQRTSSVVRELRTANLEIPESGHSKTVSAQVSGSFRSEEVPTVVDAVWPILRGINRDVVTELKAVKPEYTVSLFQKTGALHLSSLGQFRPGSDRFEPGVYLLVVPYTSKYSLGRVLDRLHSLAVLRLAAIREMRLLQGASDRINALSLEINNVVDTPDVERISELQKKFLLIGGSHEDRNFIGVGILYRVERSRYYVDEFKAVIDLMGIGSVRGFQNYHNFIKRRLYSQFDQISAIGRRYEALRNQLLYMNSAMQRANLDALQNAIATGVASTGQKVGRTNTLLANSRRQVVSTNRLLETAEMISVIPIGYYGGEILFKSLKPLQESDYKEYIPKDEAMYFVIAFIFALLLVSIRRKISKREDDEDQDFKSGTDGESRG